MAKLYFYYAAMNAGKSTTLLQADFNYRERGMETMLWTAAHDDRAGAGTIGSRIAANTTVHAAVITGIVPTGGGAYSGGAENSLRLLEDWTGKTLTFKGSLLVLYYSKVADAAWGGPGVYAPPVRAWSYDPKLSNSTGIPPSMPSARTVFRSDWTAVKPLSKS